MYYMNKSEINDYFEVCSIIYLYFIKYISDNQRQNRKQLPFHQNLSQQKNIKPKLQQKNKNTENKLCNNLQLIIYKQRVLHKINCFLSNQESMSQFMFMNELIIVYNIELSRKSTIMRTTDNYFSAFDCLKGRIMGILFQQNRVPPLAFFSLVLIKQLGFLTPFDCSYALFYLGLGFFLITCYNHFLLYSSVLITSIRELGPYNIILGVINVNEKWRLYLFWFTTGYYTIQNAGPFLQIFLIATSIFICFETYKTLMFPTVDDNLLYFVGFFTLLCIHLAKACINLGSNYSLTNPELLYVLPIFIVLGYTIIKNRITQIKSSQPSTIKNPLILLQYLQQLQALIEKDQNILGYIVAHKKICLKSNCFCHIENNCEFQLRDKNNLQNEIINNVYMQILQSRNWQQEDRLIITHKYINFLIQSRKFNLAIQMVGENLADSMSYFNRCLNYRLRNKLIQCVGDKQYFNINQNKFKYIYEYDLEVGYVLKQIRQIMYRKILLWRQLCKQNPKVKDLQKMGRQLVQKIQNLHKYFMLKVRPREDVISVFKCTIIYSLYLALTTNYIQLANSLLKKAKKIAEQAKVDIQINNQFGLLLKVTKNYHTRDQHIFQLTILNVSAGLSDILQREKQSLLYKSLTQIIPIQFQQAHVRKIDESFRKINYFQQKSLFIETHRQIPFKINSNQAVFLDTIAVLDIDLISDCPILKCIVQKTNNQSVNFIMNLDGDLLLRESEICEQYAKSDSVLDALNFLKNQWEALGIINRKEDNILTNEHSSTIILQPFFFSFFIKEQKIPLIKVNVKGDLNRNQRTKTANLIFMDNIANIEGIIQNRQTDSQTSNTSRKDSVQNILVMLMQSSSLKTQIFLVVTLFLLLIFVIGCFFVCLNCFNIWNIENKLANPVYTVYSVINMKSIFNNALSWNYDIIRTESFSNQTLELFQKIFGKSTTEYIEQMGRPKLEQMFKQQQDILSIKFYGYNTLITDLLLSQLQRIIKVKTPSQDILHLEFVQSLLANYLVDIYIMNEGQDFNKTALSTTYMSQFYSVFEDIIENLQNLLESTIRQTIIYNFILQSLVSLLIISFLFPIWRFHTRNKKKHQQIYSLLASLEPTLILDQIKKLEKMETDIFIKIPQSPLLTKKNLNQQYFYNQQRQNMKKNGQKTGEANFFGDLHMIYEGVKKLTAEQIAVNTLNKTSLKIRKRAGEIVIDGSNCDKKNIRFIDWIVLIFMIIFLGIINSLMGHKIMVIDHLKDHLDNSTLRINFIEKNIAGLLNSKIFSDYYTSQNQIAFQEKDLIVWMRDWVINFNFTTGFPIQDEIALKKCQQNILACINIHSQTIFQGLLNKIITDSFQQKLIYIQNQSIGPSILQKSRIMLFFAQQICDQISKIKIQWIQNSFIQLQQYSIVQDKTKQIISAFFAISVIIFSIFSVIYTIWVKKDYIKQVTLLAILNKQMLYNNKRVQSFLHKLSKNH